jgi:multisubunit Na+/H+ antiporter MnhE subunit
VKDLGKLAFTVLLELPVAFLLWLLFVGTFANHELLIGLVAILVAAAGRVVIEIHYALKFSPTIAELLSLWRLVWYALSGTAEIVLVAARDLLGIKRAQSLFRVADFKAGKQDDAHDTARRVLAVVYTTIAPNFIVLGINPKDQKMLFHQIERSGIPQMTQSLGAQS